MKNILNKNKNVNTEKPKAKIGKLICQSLSFVTEKWLKDCFKAYYDA